MGNLRYWLSAGFLAVVLLLNSAGVFAETIGATANAAGTQTTAATQLWFNAANLPGANKYSTWSAACDASRAARGMTKESCVDDAAPLVGSWANCKHYAFGGCNNTQGSKYATCPAGYVFDNATQQCKNNVVVYSCPSTGGWTLSGNQCTRPDCPPGVTREPDGSCGCQSGYFKDAGGVCRKDCTGKLGQPAPNGTYSTATDGFTGALNGCQVDCKTTYGMLLTDSSAFALRQDCSYNGKPAADGDEEMTAEPNPDPREPKSPKDCMGAGMGYITGSNGTTCVPSEDAPEGQKPTSVKQKDSKESGAPGTDGKPDPNASDYQKEEKSSSTNGGNTTTETKTTKNGTTDGEGNFQCPAGFTRIGTTNQCQKVTTTTESNKSFCAENPTAAICKGSTFSGSCAGGFVCTGDEATCASARATWELKCSMEKGDATSDAGKGLVDGNDPLSGTLPNQVNAGSFNLSGLTYTDTAGSCPSDWQFNIMGQTSTVSTAGLCQAGHWLGLIGVALSLLAAAFIIIGGVKN